jgi:hypothetical protein
MFMGLLERTEIAVPVGLVANAGDVGHDRATGGSAAEAIRGGSNLSGNPRAATFPRENLSISLRKLGSPEGFPTRGAFGKVL